MKTRCKAEQENERRIVVHNRKARHDYTIVETYEAGIVLVGTEVKSLRGGNASLQDAYGAVENGEVWLHNMHIAPYDQGSRWNAEPRRPRKLLLHRREIDRLRGNVERKGYALVPLRVYFRDGYAKLDLALGAGKRLYDKREAIARRDTDREAERELRSRGDD
jgi:SsrA-binding protein